MQIQKIIKNKILCCRPPIQCFFFLYIYIYSSDRPGDEAVVAARWDVRGAESRWELWRNGRERKKKQERGSCRGEVGAAMRRDFWELRRGFEGVGATGEERKKEMPDQGSRGAWERKKRRGFFLGENGEQPGAQGFRLKGSTSRYVCCSFWAHSYLSLYIIIIIIIIIIFILSATF